MRIGRKLLTALCIALIAGLCIQMVIPDSFYTITTAQAAKKIKLKKEGYA